MKNLIIPALLLSMVGCNTFDHTPSAAKSPITAPIERTVWPQSEDLSQTFGHIKLICGIAMSDNGHEAAAIESFEDFLQRNDILQVSEVDMLNDSNQTISFETTVQEKTSSFEIKAVSRVIRDEVKDQIPSHENPEVLEEVTLRKVPYMILELKTKTGTRHADVYPSFAGGVLENSKVIAADGSVRNEVTVKCNLEATLK